MLKGIGSPVGIVENTSQRVIPSRKRRQQPEEPSGLDDRRVRRALGIAVQVSDAEEQEGQVQGEEEGEECDGGTERGDQEEGGEDEPALSRVELVKWSLG